MMKSDDAAGGRVGDGFGEPRLASCAGQKGTGGQYALGGSDPGDRRSRPRPARLLPPLPIALPRGNQTEALPEAEYGCGAARV